MASQGSVEVRKEARTSAPTSGYSVSIVTEKMYLCAFRDKGDCSYGCAVVWDDEGYGACGAHQNNLARRVLAQMRAG